MRQQLREGRSVRSTQQVPHGLARTTLHTSTTSACEPTREWVVKRLDARSKIIIDSCEATSIRLQWSTLQLCLGDSTYVKIADARELHRQVEGISKKSRSRPQASKKNPYQLAKRKERRERARDLQLYRSLVKP